MYATELDQRGLPPAVSSEQEAPKQGGHTLKDLPWLFQKWLPWHPRHYPIIFVFIQIISQSMVFLAMVQVTGSLAVAGAIAGLLCASNCSFLFTADFSKGIFLEILTEDLENSRKMAKEAQSGAVFFFVMFQLIITGLIVWFFIVPLAQTTMLGPYTYTITIVLFVLSWICSGITFGFGCHQLLLPTIPKVWGLKIKTYLTRVRNILLLPEAEINETGQSIVELLSIEQKSIEGFALQINEDLGVGNSMDIIVAAIQSIVMAFFIPGGTVSTIVICSLVTLINTVYFVKQLYGLANPSMIFDKYKRQLLNDAKVQQGKLRIGWTVDMFDNWMERHESNAMRVFGMKVTLDKMRQASGFFASLVTIIMYFLLRDELRRFA